jgi:hypothetical protein
MNSDVRKQILDTWVQGLPLKQQVIVLFEKVRDIPYGSIGSRDPIDVYESNEGTCSGKHELLKELYQELGIEVKDFVAMHKFKDMQITYPAEIQKILDRSEIIDPHNYFKINFDGKWLLVDVTWDKPLKKAGFIVNENWSAGSDMKICVVPLSIHETDDPISFKKNEIAKLTEHVQADRKLFLDELTRWTKIIRS